LAASFIILKTQRDVRYWHKADIPEPPSGHQDLRLPCPLLFGECRLNRLGGIHGGKKNAPESSGAITFSGTFSGTLVGARSGAGAGVGAGV
jgi:hypothetical protein